MAQVFGKFAGVYLKNGWTPVPVEMGSKRIAVDGFTGHDGEYPTARYVMDNWNAKYGAYNIGLRLGQDVIGIDVDAYGERDGGSSLELLENELGYLPYTYVSTSRDDGVSGIRLFRVPRRADANWRGKAAGGIDVISWHYRYVVCEPSIHPSTGNVYAWFLECHNGGGIEFIPCDVPAVADLPVLPEIWQEFLSSDFTGVKSEKLDTDVITDWLSMVGCGEPCEVISETASMWVSAVGEASDAGGIHDAVKDGIHSLLGDAVAGHAGALDELSRLEAAFRNARDVRHDDRSGECDAEWRRLLYGEVRLRRGTESLCDDPCTDEYASASALKSMRPKLSGGGVYDRDEKEIARRARELRLNRAAKRRVDSENAAEAPGLMILSDWMNRDLEPPIALVPGLIALEGNTLLVAQPKAGKTTMVHNLLRAVVDDDDFLDVYPVEAIPHGKRIVLLDFEMHEGQLNQYLDEQGIRNRDGAAISSLSSSASSFNILDSSCLEKWIKDLEYVNAGYIILDCCAPAWAANGIEENSATEQGAWLDAFNTLVHECGAYGSLLVHHTGKVGESARGSSRIEGWASDLLRLTLQGAGEDDDGKFVNADRFLSARGRIITEFTEVMTEKYGRRLRVSGGSKTEVAAERIQPSVIAFIENAAGTSRNAVEKNVHGRADAIRHVINELIKDGSVCDHGKPRMPALFWGCPDPTFHGKLKV